jgi:hypothetical protein
MSWSPTTSHWRWALKTAALLVTSHGPAMSVLTKNSEVWTIPAAILHSSAPKQRHKKGAGWRLPCCEIAPNFAPLVPGLTPWSWQESYRFTRQKREFDRPILLWSSFMDDTPQPCRSFRWCLVRNSWHVCTASLSQRKLKWFDMTLILWFCHTGFSKIQAIHGSQERQSIGIELPEILRCCAVFSPLLTLRQPRWSSLHRFLAAVVFFQPRSLGRSFDEMLATCL